MQWHSSICKTLMIEGSSIPEESKDASTPEDESKPKLSLLPKFIKDLTVLNKPKENTSAEKEKTTITEKQEQSSIILRPNIGRDK